MASSRWVSWARFRRYLSILPKLSILRGEIGLLFSAMIGGNEIPSVVQQYTPATIPCGIAQFPVCFQLNLYPLPLPKRRNSCLEVASFLARNVMPGKPDSVTVGTRRS